jgi:hypothetical protein
MCIFDILHNFLDKIHNKHFLIRKIDNNQNISLRKKIMILNFIKFKKTSFSDSFWPNDSIS